MLIQLLTPPESCAQCAPLSISIEAFEPMPTKQYLKKQARELSPIRIIKIKKGKKS